MTHSFGRAGSKLRQALAAGVMLAVLASCSSGSDPTAPEPLPGPTFEPPEGTVEMLGGETVTFRVLDRAGRPVRAEFFLDGTRLVEAESFVHEVQPSSKRDVIARARIDGVFHIGRWTVNGYSVRFEPPEPYPWMLTGQELNFVARVSNDADVPATFFLDREQVSEGSSYLFVPTVDGVHRIEVEAEVLGATRRSSWELTVASLDASPAQGEIATFPYERIELSVTRSDGGRVDASFVIEDYASSVGDAIEYMPVVAVNRQARASIETSAGVASASWMLIDASTVPAVGGLALTARDPELVLDLVWTVDPPTENQKEPASYLVAYATRPFGPDEREKVENLILPHRSGARAQGGSIGGVPALTTCYVRVFAQDAEGRVGFGTPMASVTTSDPGERIELSGVARFLPWPGVLASAEGFSAGVQNQATVLGAAGAFAFTTYSNGGQYLWLEGDGVEAMRVGPLPRTDVHYELLVLPTRDVSMLSAGTTSDLALVDYIRALTDNARTVDSDPTFHRWARYPVKVWVWDYTGPGTEHPSYDAAFRRAIDLWNGGSTGDDRLLEYVGVADSLFDPSTDPGQEGVLVRLYSEGGSTNLAQVDFIRPASGRIASTDPEILEVRLRRFLPTQPLLDRVVAHELGHTLGLIHSPSEADLMHAFVDMTGGIPGEHEIYVARFLRHVRPGSSNLWY